MKAVYFIGILLFMLFTVSSASAVSLTNTNIYQGSIPSGASINIDVTYNAADKTITFVDSSTGLTDPRITWVGYNLDVSAKNVAGFTTPSDTKPIIGWTEQQNFGALGTLGNFLRIYKEGQPNPPRHVRKVVVTLPSFDGTIPGNDNFGNQVGVHFVCKEFSGFVAGPTSEKPPTPDTPIPEFPSMVLPVAAILGLIFISQRKRREN